jgi:hypothetical protein
MRPFQQKLRSLGVGLLTAALATVAAPVTSAAPAPVSTATTRAPATFTGGRVLTLITGDKVRVSADGQQVQPIPAAGRAGTAFKIQRWRDHVSVIPTDALARIGSGRVDPRLFDVTELLSRDGAHSTSTGPSTTKPSTAASVGREQESYNLTIKHLDRTGAVTGDYLDIILNRQSVDELPLYLSEEDGTTNVRLPKGQYLLDTTVGQQRGRTEASNLVRPMLDLTSDTTITVDARQAKPIAVSVPDATARNVFTSVEYAMVTPGFTWSSGVADVPDGGSGAKLYTAQVGPSVPGFDGRITSQWARPDPDGGEFFDNTPYLYALGWPRAGGYFTGFSKAVRSTELATLKPAISAQSAGTSALFGMDGQTNEVGGGIGYGYPYNRLPATPSVYVTTEGVSWNDYLIYTDGNTEPTFLYSQPATYRPGRTYRENWGRAVVGPAFPQHSSWVSRTGDTLRLMPPQADSDGHYDQERNHGCVPGRGEAGHAGLPTQSAGEPRARRPDRRRGLSPRGGDSRVRRTRRVGRYPDRVDVQLDDRCRYYGPAVVGGPVPTGCGRPQRAEDRREARPADLRAGTTGLVGRAAEDVEGADVDR